MRTVLRKGKPKYFIVLLQYTLLVVFKGSFFSAFPLLDSEPIREAAAEPHRLPAGLLLSD